MTTPGAGSVEGPPREIRGNAKNLRELLGGARFAVDYYQREYKWQTKQVAELLDDLADKFLQSYETGQERSAVERYGHYFLGSIIVSDKAGRKFIIDGQQRITARRSTRRAQSTRLGLQDVSHMSFLEVPHARSLAFLERIVDFVDVRLRWDIHGEQALRRALKRASDYFQRGPVLGKTLEGLGVGYEDPICRMTATLRHLLDERTFVGVTSDNRVVVAHTIGIEGHVPKSKPALIDGFRPQRFTRVVVPVRFLECESDLDQVAAADTVMFS